MRHRILKAFVLALTAASVTHCASSAAVFGQSQAAAETRTFQRANRTDIDYERSIFDFEAANCKFKVKSNGIGTKNCVGARQQKFRLAVEPLTRISHLLFFVKEKTIYLIEESEDFESGWAEIRAYRLQTMRRRWTQHIRDFNISPALVEGNHVYLSGVGLVAKLDLLNGGFIWRNEGLYEKGLTSDDPLSPTIDGDKVTFPSKGFGSMRTLTYDKRSGKLLSRL